MGFRSTHVEWLLLLLMYAQIYCNSESEGSTGKPRLNVHSAPHNVKAVQVGKMDVLVTWEMPESHRIHNLTYRVFYAPVEDRIQLKSIDVPSSQEAIIGGLTQGETYTIRVAALSPQGQGHMSHPVTVSILYRGEYLLLLDVRQIGAQNVLVQWDKFNFTDIELESVKKVVLNHKMLGTLAVDVHNVLDWKTKTHFLLRDVDPNNKHTFQLVVLFELRSQSPIVSKPAEFELVPRASDELMIHLTADVEIYDMQQVQEYSNYGYRYVTRCTRVTEGNILNPDQYDNIKTQEIKCNVTSKGEVVATEITFFKGSITNRKLVVTDDKILTWIMAHF